MPHRFAIALLFLLWSFLASANDQIGVLVMHGKGGSPDRQIAGLVSQLRGKGYRVSAPVMPWSGVYDRTMEECFALIDREFDALREQGARRVVVGGHSLGANVALAYAAARPVDGVIGLAPGHIPDHPRARETFADDVKRAREMIAAGKGGEVGRFGDVNQGQRYPIAVRADVYLSWFDPEGKAAMPLSAAAIARPTPILWVIGSREPFAAPQSHIFDRAPAHPKSRFLTISADHLGVPNAAVRDVLGWLATLAD